jgi:4-hydroxybenzoate polyprenyltransferase
LSLCAFALVLALGRPLVIAMSVPALFLAASYPFTKRFLAIPQAYLGIAFGFGIPMAYAAQQGGVPAEAWWLLLANVFWAVAYDTEYAMVDRNDDLKIGIKTSAITFGRFDVAAVMGCYAATLAIIGGVGYGRDLGAAFYASLAVAAGIMGVHFTWIRGRERMACFKAFLHNNWVGAVIFAGIVVDYLVSGRSFG